MHREICSGACRWWVVVISLASIPSSRSKADLWKCKIADRCVLSLSVHCDGCRPTIGQWFAFVQPMHFRTRISFSRAWKSDCCLFHWCGVLRRMNDSWRPCKVTKTVKLISVHSNPNSKQIPCFYLVRSVSHAKLLIFFSIKCHHAISWRRGNKTALVVWKWCSMLSIWTLFRCLFTL